jgi:hypothetical protein
MANSSAKEDQPTKSLHKYVLLAATFWRLSPFLTLGACPLFIKMIKKTAGG